MQSPVPAAKTPIKTKSYPILPPNTPQHRQVLFFAPPRNPMPNASHSLSLSPFLSLPRRTHSNKKNPIPAVTYSQCCQRNEEKEEKVKKKKKGKHEKLDTFL